MRLRGFEFIRLYKSSGIKLPERQTKNSAGYDFAAAEDVLISPKEIALIPTGIKAYMGENEYLGIHIRSSIAVKQHLMLINGQGIIDADYYNNPANEGHILVAVYNYGNDVVGIKKGTRIAQGIFYTYLTADSDKSSEIQRSGGFGSTSEN